ncbi:hypothetical protein A3F28_00070 [Candidatus Uhrbacteria bacterium RIFCSPHIGHO2_12_FULL_57_11]|uniref:Tetratricopeptide repeat protein n=1 Tax=Candidatus Uhrbacteria bacterium RIFCSPHIGHO2_12_FULL_57_11 TaxID=1802398 RepID=A0A1F7UPV4_9BACT|nr:MAG: hypothetical protein A3F28_00070 [Candidatus Uhrbacteria bacterium RIFCSPHIGHO2_12_FULL_57_11]
MRITGIAGAALLLFAAGSADAQEEPSAFVRHTECECTDFREGVRLFEEGRWGESVESFERAWQRVREMMRPEKSLTILNDVAQNLDLARAQRDLRIDVERPGPQFRAGVRLYRQRRWDEAAAAFTYAFERMRPGRGADIVALDLALAQEQAGQQVEAGAIYGRLRLSPNLEPGLRSMIAERLAETQVIFGRGGAFITTVDRPAEDANGWPTELR